MLHCPYCDQEHPDDSLFCPVTGKTLVPVRKLCPQCGQAVDPNWVHCGYCGQILTKVEASISENQPWASEQATVTDTQSTPQQTGPGKDGGEMQRAVEETHTQPEPEISKWLEGVQDTPEATKGTAPQAQLASPEPAEEIAVPVELAVMDGVSVPVEEMAVNVEPVKH